MMGIFAFLLIIRIPSEFFQGGSDCDCNKCRLRIGEMMRMRRAVVVREGEEGEENEEGGGEEERSEKGEELEKVSREEVERVGEKERTEEEQDRDEKGGELVMKPMIIDGGFGVWRAAF